MATGTVKWFNDDMRFEFVTSDNGRGELFAHRSEISTSSYKLLKKGPKVAFKVTQIPGGKAASYIRIFT